MWVDSAATVHSIRDRQTHADHLVQTRISYPDKHFPASGLDSSQLITVIHRKATPNKLL